MTERWESSGSWIRGAVSVAAPSIRSHIASHDFETPKIGILRRLNLDYKTGHRRPPPPFAIDRQPGARQPYELLAAYRCWLAYLQHGSIRAAANALDINRRNVERYSKRWRWLERTRRILARHASQWADVFEYEERHNLDAAENVDEMIERDLESFTEVTAPRLSAEGDEAFRELEKQKPDLTRILRWIGR